MRRITAARRCSCTPYSPTVLPVPTDWGPDQLVTGYWRLPARVRAGAGETVPTTYPRSSTPARRRGTSAWACPFATRRKLIADVAAVNTQLGVRALVDSEYCADVDTLPEHLHAVGTVDHGQLLPRRHAPWRQRQ